MHKNCYFRGNSELMASQQTWAWLRVASTLGHFGLRQWAALGVPHLSSGPRVPWGSDLGEATSLLGPPVRFGIWIRLADTASLGR